MKKIDFFALWLLRVSIIASLVYTLTIDHWVGTAGGIIVFASTFIIEYLNKKYFKIKKLFMSTIYVYMAMSLVMGSMWNLYDKLWWWDIFMHIMSGIILGMLGNIILEKQLHRNSVPKVLRFLFILGIACIGGIIWELYEFTVDGLFNLDTQLASSTGLNDTMWDLISDLAGGIITGVALINLNK